MPTRFLTPFTLLVWLVFPACIHPFSLEFSPPTLVSFSPSGKGTTPSVPDYYFPLASAVSGGQPLLFGVQDPATYTVSQDSGSSWEPMAAPSAFTSQCDGFVPLYDTLNTSTGAPPVGYHTLGGTLLPPTPGGWELQGIVTVGPSSEGNGLSLTYNATARTTLVGVPGPGLNTTCTLTTSPPCYPPRFFGPIRLVDGSYLLAATAAFAGTPPHPTPDGPRAPVSLLAFTSLDTFTWRFTGVIANASSFPWTDFGPTESDLAYAADGSTLVCVIRMSGDSACLNGGYRSYFVAYSADGGATWTLPAELPGLGCVRPRLLRMGGGGPMVLSGGRNCVAGTKDITLWTAATVAPASTWAQYSITYQHNALWRGNASFLFDARVNDTALWETLSYTSIVPATSPGTFAVFYNKFFTPNTWPPWPAANFMMQVRVV